VQPSTGNSHIRDLDDLLVPLPGLAALAEIPGRSGGRNRTFLALHQLARLPEHIHHHLLSQLSRIRVLQRWMERAQQGAAVRQRVMSAMGKKKSRLAL
jgi:hypothetical protein